jgi:membrane-bound serine protease (ClpP class)
MPHDAGSSSGNPVLFLLFLIFIVIGIRLAIVSYRKRSISGRESIIGMAGKAVTELSPQGKAFVGGVYYNAESVSGEIAQGSDIQVVDMVGIKLKVKQVGG